MMREDWEKRKRLFYKKIDQLVVSGSRITREKVIARHIHHEFHNDSRGK